MDIFDSLGRIVSFVFGLILVGAYLAWKWKQAGETSEAMAAERVMARQSFEALKHDPRFAALMRYIGAKHRTAFERTADPETYCIRFIGLWGVDAIPVFAQQGANARWIVAYLDRPQSPARLQVSMDLQTGVCGETELSSFAWEGVVPAMA